MFKFTDVAGEMQAIERVCRSGKMSVKWIDEADANQTPRTDLVNKVLFLPKPRVSWTEHERKINRAYAYHEHGHHHPSQAPYFEYLFENFDNTNNEWCRQLNIVDDVWQEMVTSVGYAGAAHDLSYCQGTMAKSGIQTVVEQKATDQVEAKLFALVYAARSEWQGHVNGEDWLDNVDVSMHMDLIPRINGIITHPDPVQEMIDILTRFNEDEPSQDKTPEELQEEAKSGDGDKEESDQPGEDSGGGKSGDQTDEEGDEEVASSGTISYEDLMMHTESEEGGKYASDIEINYDHTPRIDYMPYGLDDISVETPPNEKKTDDWDCFPYEEVLRDTAKVSRSISRLFQSRSQTALEYNHKRGRLTSKHLTRGAMGDPNIFHKKINRIDNNADVYILIDFSGSMLGRKRDAAVPAAARLSEALTAAKVPNKVAGFSERIHTLHHYILKDWNESVQPDTMCARSTHAKWSQNADGDSLMVAYRDLMARNNKRKILLVLSDGQPCCDNSGDADTYLRQVTSFIQSTDVELYGIGICTRAVERYYRDYVVLNNPDQIEEVLTDVIKSKIIGD